MTKTLKETKSDNEENKDTFPTSKIFGELFGYLFFLFFLFYILPSLNFVTDDLKYWQPITLVCTSIGSLFKIFRHLSNTRSAKSLYDIIGLFANIFSTVMLLKIFPFDFSITDYPGIEFYLRFALTIAILAMIFAIFVNFIKMLIPENLFCKKSN